MAEPFGLTIEGLDDLKAVSDYRYLVQTPTRRFMKAAAAAFRQAAVRQSPKGRTKKYSRSWKDTIAPDGMSFTVANTDEPVATFIALGTKPHLIRARNRKALWWPGALHPVVAVSHPGTKPNDVAGRAAAEAQKEVFGPIKAAWDAEIEARWEKRGIGQ